jgi:membrane-associated phospholipid phosphatase
MKAIGFSIVLTALVVLTPVSVFAQASGTPLVLADAALQPNPAQPAPAQPRPDPDASGTSAEHDPFVWLFPNLFRDIVHLPSIETAITLGVGGAAAAALYPIDDNVAERTAGGDDGRFFDVGSRIGSGWVQIGGAVGTYVVGAVSGKRTVTHLGRDLIRAQVLNALLTQGIKVSVRRDRPGSTSRHSYAFPSGHTSSAFATASVLWRHFGWKTGVPAAAVGAWVGSSRVQLDKHYVTDVVFGAALGVAAGRTVTIGHGAKAVALAPAAVPGGAALMFTLVER